MPDLTLANLTLDAKPKRHRPSPLLIPELLELILTSVPPLQVLTGCRRVCRLWRDVINTSPVIKFSTWRSESIPGRKPPRITRKSYHRNPLILDILASFWYRLNNLDEDDDKKKKSKRKKDSPALIKPYIFLKPYVDICDTLIFANSSPLDINIRITVQKYASKHIIARSYRSLATDIGIGWVTDLKVLINLMEEIIALKNEGVYVEGKRNSMQAEIGGCLFLYSDEEEGGKRRECEVLERVDFGCTEPWGVGIVQVGRVREVIKDEEGEQEQ